MFKPAVRRALLLLAACLSVSCATSRPPSAPLVEAPAVTVLTPDDAPLGLRRSIVADQYFWLRAKALEGEAPPPFAEALAAMNELRGELAGDAAAWEDLEVPLGSVGRASELSAAYADLPRVREVEGKPVPLRAHALRLAHALEKSEPAFRAGPFREHEAEIARAAKELTTQLLPRIEGILGSLESEMALPGVGRPIVLTLVSDAPYPGIFAADARGHATASFVRVHGLSGGALCETVLHETLHAIDELTVRSPTAMNMLRSALARRGIDESDPSVEMAVNTVTFAEAASLVRRYVDPAHRPLGESGFYTLFPSAAAIAVAWNEHIAGESLDVTADAIAKAVTATP